MIVLGELVIINCRTLLLLVKLQCVSIDSGFNYVGERFDNVRILCLIYTRYGIGILW